MLNGIFEVPEDYIENGDGTGRAVYKAGNGLRAQFEKVFVLNEGRTLETGKESFEESIVVLIQAKGDSNIVAHRMTDQHKRMFPQQWRRFEQGATGELGQSIVHLYGMTPNLVAAFTARGVFTVTQLAECSDEVLADIPDGERARALAQVFLSTRKGESDTASLIVEVHGYKTRNAELEAEAARLRAELAKAKPKRVRTKRVKEKTDV